MTLFQNPLGANHDIIPDFNPGIDVISLQGIDFVTFTFVAGGSFTGDAGEVIVQSGGTTFVYADVNGDSVADMTIELSGNKTLTEGDFIG